MNKSKFLKKSLAMVLAIMMVVAMIPLGASAAETAKAAISAVTVGYDTDKTAVATKEGNTFTADLPMTEDSITLTITMENGFGVPYFVDVNGVDQQVAPAANGVYTTTTLSAEEYGYQFTLKTTDTDGVPGETYTLKINRVPEDTNETVKSFVISGQYGASVIDHSANTITAVVPYGTSTPVNATVTVNGKNATVDSNPVDPEGKYTVSFASLNTETAMTVTAESGATRTYMVTIKTAEGFSAFSVDGQLKEATIEKDADGNDADNQIFVTMPYGTKADDKGSLKVIPTFKTTYPSAKVELQKKDGATFVAFESGKEIDLADFVSLTANEALDSTAKDVTAKITYTGVGATENWTIHFVAPDKNPAAEITKLTIGNYEAKIDGTRISVEIPGKVTTCNLNVEGSVNAGVQVVGTVTSANLTAGKATLSGVDCTDTVTLRVTSEENDPQKTVDYYLTVKSAQPEAASIKTITLQDADGKDAPVAIDHTAGTITFSVPYSIDDRDAVETAKYKLFYQLSQGASSDELMDAGKTINGEEINTTTKALFPSVFDGKTKDGTAIVVETKDPTTNAVLSQKTYKIVVKRLNAEVGRTLSSYAVTKESKYDDLTEDNQYSVKVSSNTITLPVPYKDYTTLGANVYSIFEVSKGAKVYLVNGTGSSQTATEIVPVTEDTDGVTTIALADCDGSTDSKYVTLAVVSEQGHFGNDVTTDYDAFKASNIGKVTEYKLVVKQSDPRKTKTVKTVGLYDDTSKQTVNGTVGANTISFKVPYGISKEAKLFMPYEVTGGETFKVFTSNAASGAEVEYKTDKDGNFVETGSSWFAIDGDGDLCYNGTVAGDKVTKFVAYAENHTVGAPNYTEYQPNVTVVAPEKGAEMKSFSLNNAAGKIDNNKNTIAVTVPYGTEITALKAVFTASTNAVVMCGGTRMFSGETALNYTNPVTITVSSEDGSNVNHYTVTVTVSDQFSDVDTDDWFYNDVMTAAAKGWITGTGNGNFSPASGMKRGDFALMITRVLNADLSAYEGKTAFPDIPADKYYAAAVAYCAENGYLNGYEDGKFYGERTIDRNAMAKIICTVKGLSEVTSTTNPFADDAKIPSWAKGYVYACAEAGIILGDTNNNFNGSKIAKRSEAAAVLVRAFA